MSTLGIDASAFSGNLDWDAVARDCGFVCLKGTDGVNDVDRTLMLRANNARRVGLGDSIVVYHFLHARHGMRQDADEQAKQALEAMANAGGSEMWLDIEMDSLSGGRDGALAKCIEDAHGDPKLKAQIRDEVKAAAELFVLTWNKILGPPLDGYSSGGEIDALGLGAVDAFTQLPLALAQYIRPIGSADVPVPMHPPHLPTPYTSWRFWQYGGNCPRYGGNVDLLIRND